MIEPHLQNDALEMTIRFILCSALILMATCSCAFHSPLAGQKSSAMNQSFTPSKIFRSFPSKTDRDELVQEVLAMSRKIGPVGSFASKEDQNKLEELAKTLESLSDKNPTQRPLRGIHAMVYSAAPGGSSGRLVGPFYGRVTQEFVNDETFINAVQFGPLEISLRATRAAKSGRRNSVKFLESTVRLFGQTLVQKEISGGGVWDYIFIGEVTDKDGSSKLIRIMKTPSLFVLEQPL